MKIMEQQCSLSLKNQKKELFNFRKILKASYKIEVQNGNYAKENPIKFITNSIESSLCDYFDTFILLQEI